MIVKISLFALMLNAFLVDGMWHWMHQVAILDENIPEYISAKRYKAKNYMTEYHRHSLFFFRSITTDKIIAFSNRRKEMLKMAKFRNCYFSPIQCILPPNKGRNSRNVQLLHRRIIH